MELEVKLVLTLFIKTVSSWDSLIWVDLIFSFEKLKKKNSFSFTYFIFGTISKSIHIWMYLEEKK